MTLSPEEYDFLTPAEPGCGLGRLGRYPLRRVLSHGGMATLFEGVHPDLGHALAIKTLHKSILAQLLQRGFDPKRLLDEARLTAGVKSDYVVAVHDGGYHPAHSASTLPPGTEVPFAVLELLRGETLTQRLKARKKLSPLETIVILRDIAKGLDATDEAGVVHGDVKPDNIWLEAERDRAKLLDYSSAESVHDPYLSRLLGAQPYTALYASPEQLGKGPVDRRSDLYSLGVVAYQMLTGRLPARIGGRVLLSPHAVEPQVPRDLSDLVMYLLEPAPARRCQDAAELLGALDTIQCALFFKDLAPLSGPALAGQGGLAVAALTKLDGLSAEAFLSQLCSNAASAGPLIQHLARAIQNPPTPPTS